MRDTRLILVEGIMGSGKSSTATFLSLQLQWNGVKYRYIHEGEIPQPTRLRDHILPPSSPAEYIEKSLESWQYFVDNATTRDCVYVFDGQPFHGDTTEMILMGAEEGAIEEYIDRLMEIIGGLNPTLIYFYQENIASALRKICDERGQGWENHQVEWKTNTLYGRKNNLQEFAGFVEVYKHYRTWTDRLVATLACSKLTIENSASLWATYCRDMLDYLGLPYHRPEIIVDDNDLSKVFPEQEVALSFSNTTDHIVEIYRLGFGESDPQFFLGIFPGETAGRKGLMGSLLSCRKRFSNQALQTVFITEENQHIVI
ncbi:MAG: hypothetical protein GKR89_03010 [Candidatus Latescibacteria bacterium]|nr:hypothetical protein [Candidatus Latescibacterota bacterium]